MSNLQLPLPAIVLRESAAGAEDRADRRRVCRTMLVDAALGALIAFAVTAFFAYADQHTAPCRPDTDTVLSAAQKSCSRGVLAPEPGRGYLR